ncbi:hypothetical protein NX059_011682 [Plenodomus lindquistii]|nr:hypothetical protein NX059_011682 [Plenodomus lindquistii]
MQLSINLALFSAALVAAYDKAALGLAEPNGATVYLCNESNFQGYCQNFSTRPSGCIQLGDDLNRQISSVLPARGSYCYFFTADNCETTGETFHVGYPGFSDLSDVPVNGPVGSTRNYNNKISSYFCTFE